ncbi:type II toxin-antitoxin system RelE/ParE family toxin [Massilia arenosa]|uniref:Type II toxin-antitoxin system RelE/ParE family toxin n=1 Tax=Zemynaea arenosa TaxID=2561931 RepID=A0A4Y9SJI9_9BURK|nr:type II toxin-antitoxin system RelE/ParE family toxin [Massilia arenosa]TFW26258.1 type II toxin-antitoxin system RelE/ParE family toxin [Massilia arenosa]
MKYRVRFSAGGREDLARLMRFIAERDRPSTKRVRAAIASATRLLEQFPFSCRKALPDDPFLREMVVPFGATGFVLLYKIQTGGFVTIIAARHQREDDYH